MYTLADIRLAAKQRADMENSSFLSDAEWDKNINSSYAELYDILVSRFEDYFTVSTTLTYTSTNTQALPADFYKLRGVDYDLGGNWETVRKWNFDDRNKVSFRRCYRVVNQNLIIMPEDNASGTYRLWYAPRFTPLASGSSNLSNVLDFEEYIIIDAAIKALVKEESDVSVLSSRKEALRQRILAMASNRDNQPDRIADVSTRFNDELFPWRY